MRSPKNETQSIPSIFISGGDKTYRLDIAELSDFFEQCQRYQVNDVADMDMLFQEIMHMTVNGATSDDNSIESMKQAYNFLKELKILFQGLFVEERRDHAA